jgi:hypothetical protein
MKWGVFKKLYGVRKQECVDYFLFIERRRQVIVLKGDGYLHVETRMISLK